MDESLLGYEIACSILYTVLTSAEYMYHNRI